MGAQPRNQKMIRWDIAEHISPGTDHPLGTRDAPQRESTRPRATEPRPSMTIKTATPPRYGDATSHRQIPARTLVEVPRSVRNTH